MTGRRREAIIKHVKEQWDIVVLVAAVVYFVIRLSIFAISIDPYVPPDEVTHFGISQLYGQSFLPPDDSEDSYQFGLISHKPYVYYFLMGRLLNINVFSFDELRLLRLFNVLLGLFSVFTGYLWMCLLTKNKFARSLFVCMLTNTLMFSFLSASVNYDNLTNLLAATSLYCLTRFLRFREPATLAGFFIATFVGTLTKITFLPLALIFLLVLCFRERHAIFQSCENLISLARATWRGNRSLFTMTAIVLGLNVHLYGVNLLRFKHLVPNSEQVLSLDQCMQNRVFARSFINNQYRDHKITFCQAALEIKNIPHQGDQDDALEMLEVTRQLHLERQVFMTQSKYSQHWMNHMLKSTYGILGHRTIFHSQRTLQSYGWLFVISTCVLIVTRFTPGLRNLDGSGPETHIIDWIVVISFYMSVLIFLNYRLYLETAHPTLAVQGRYLFVIIVPVYGLTACGLICYLPKSSQVIVCLAIGIFFVWGDFPFFLYSATPEWFARP